MEEIQEPMKGILKTSEWGDTKTYFVQCECGNDACAHDLWIEADECNISVEINVKATSRWYEKTRLRQLWTLLTKGYVDTQAVIYLDKVSALNYSNTLKKAIQDVEDFRNERRGTSAEPKQTD